MDQDSMRPDAARRPERSFTLPDRYRVRRHIASGGMASVWCADDLVLDRSVAIKVLAERFAHDGVAVARFKREARAAARVSNHSHVVTVYDVGELAEPDDAPADATHAAGRAFIVMEYLAGGTVADAIRHDSVRRHEAMRWLREAASALDHAHERGIVHRDIKPANFLLDRARVLHVADFGIARLTSEETITSSDQLFGTAAYLSPEQALGREATGASDRYALAVCAFELLAGERPFSAPHFSTQARQHIEEPPPAASEIDHSLSPAVDEVLYAGLAKDPDARPHTAGAFVAALKDAVVMGESSGRGTGRRRPVPRAPDPAAPAASTAAARRHHDTRPPTDRLQPPRATARELGRSRIVALGALAAATLLIVGVVVATLHHGHRTSSRIADAHLTTTRRPRTVSHPLTRHIVHHAVKSAPKRTSATTTVVQDPAQLQSTGHQEMLAGDYSTAIPTLKEAVSSAPPGSTTYAYALYDLGRSEVLAGDPQAAIPVLRQRLRIPNQQGTVKAMLDTALADAGQGNAATTTSQTATSTTPTTPPATAGGKGAGGSGGGGLGDEPGRGQGGGAINGGGPSHGNAPNGNATRKRQRGGFHSPVQILTAAAAG